VVVERLQCSLVLLIRESLQKGSLELEAGAEGEGEAEAMERPYFLTVAGLKSHLLEWRS
jgi:hypothetical protein